MPLLFAGLASIEAFHIEGNGFKNYHSLAIPSAGAVVFLFDWLAWLPLTYEVSGSNTTIKSWSLGFKSFKELDYEETFTSQSQRSPTK